MPCFEPVEAWQLEDGRIRFCERGRIRRALKLRCGQCVGCRKDRANEWAARICHESLMHRSSWFATLTYDDEHLPPDGSLNYSHFQAFMRRLRKRAKKAIRFYMAGEYGDRTGRPHYHACLFGLELPDLRYYRKSPSGNTLHRSDMLDEIWSHGLCSVGLVTPESAAYCAAYINKKQRATRSPNLYRRVDVPTGEVHFVTPEFSRMSLKPGIGASWFAKYSSDYTTRDKVILNGREVRVPRYYRQLEKAADPFGYDEREFARIAYSDSSASERTPSRLEARKTVAEAKASRQLRNL